MTKDFFEMTRHERRGAIVILVIIVLLLVATCVLRCHRSSDIPAETEVIRMFEAEVDSSTVEINKPQGKKPEKSQKKRHKPKTPKPPKSAPSPRPVDSVPQF